MQVAVLRMQRVERVVQLASARASPNRTARAIAPSAVDHLETGDSGLRAAIVQHQRGRRHRGDPERAVDTGTGVAQPGVDQGEPAAAESVTGMRPAVGVGADLRADPLAERVADQAARAGRRRREGCGRQHVRR